MKRIVLLITAFAFFTSLQAQIETPSASPSSKVEQRVGLTDITITYSRPSVKGRTIFADNGLLPFGEFWRVGANQATKFEFSDDITMGGKEIPAGAYTILAKPGKKEWTVMLFPYETSNWSSYTEKETDLVWTLAPQMLKDQVETFLIDVNNFQDNKANINISWADTRISLPIEVNYDDKVMAAIERTMAGPSTNEYYAAASYMFDNGKDQAKALEYIQKVNAQNPRYWTLRLESLILAGLNKTPNAIKTAEKSMKMAKEAGDMNYVRMNEASIKEWSGK